jgi:methionine-rich copper-binding protein CopC
MRTLLAATIGVGLAFIGVEAASAHAKLIAAEPAIGSAAKGAPSALALMFSETISAKLSGATISAADGKPIAASPALAASGKRLTLTLRAPLKPGAYVVDWHAVASDDGHKTTGTYKFAVR